MIKIYTKAEKGNKEGTVVVELNVEGSRLDLIREMTAILASMEDQHPEILLAAVQLHMDEYFDYVEREDDDD